MHNIVLITLFISSLINYIKGGSYSTLNCGIWAFMGKNSRGFSKDKFNLLGIINDTRGGDASGFLSGNNVKHIVNKGYSDLIEEYVVPSPKHNIVLGHSRKASSGGKFIQYTQPYCYSEEDNIIGGAIHNGTLYNSEELKKKYDVPDKFIYDGKEYSPNDTQILSYILIKQKNYDVLKEYRGAASIIWENKEDGLGYVFKGASRKYNYATSEVTEERPLFSYNNKKGLWLSSLEAPLWMIAEDESPNIDPVVENTVLVIENGVIVDEIPIDRSNAAQVKSFTNNSSWGGYNEEDYFPNSVNVGGFNNRNKPKDTQLQLPIISQSIKNNPGTPLHVFAQEAESLNLTEKIVQYASGRYYMKENKASAKKLVHGAIYLDEIGYYSKKTDDDAKLYYFTDGIMLPDHASYQKASKALKRVKKGKLIPGGCLSNSDTDAKRLSVLMEYAIYPVTNIKHEYLYTSMGAYNKSGNSYTGSFAPLFSNKKYTFYNGRLTHIEVVPFNSPDHKESDDNKQNKIALEAAAKVLTKNEIFFEEGDFYKKEEYGETTVIKYFDALDHYGKTYDDILHYIDKSEVWVKSTMKEWIESGEKAKEKKKNENASSSLELTEEQKAWYEEIYNDGVSKDFDQVIKLLNKIEDDTLSESWLESSKTVQALVDDLKDTILNSKLNIA